MNISKFILFACVLGAPGIKLQAMDKFARLCSALASQNSRIDRTQFKELANYSKSFLAANANRLACQKNESGFVRINIPISNEVRSKFNGITKIRTNYWTPNAGVDINPESIHTHPYYFESYVVKGGYSHELYELGNKGHEKYDLYRILKQGTNKDFAFVGSVPLQFIKTEAVSQGDIKAFDQELIHRVTSTEPKTLSLNVVFDESEEDALYNVFLTKDGILSDIKTTRGLISGKNSKQFIAEIVSALTKFTESPE